MEFFFNETATTEIYTLSLHDALPICRPHLHARRPRLLPARAAVGRGSTARRSEEHTSELQSRENLVCRLLLEKKNKTQFHITICVHEDRSDLHIAKINVFSRSRRVVE